MFWEEFGFKIKTIQTDNGREFCNDRGAYEAGIQLCSAYPGTPSTEILENMVLYKDDIYRDRKAHV